MKFPLTLAGGLQAAFAEFVSNPLPERFAALLRELTTNRDERSGEESSPLRKCVTAAVDM